MIMHTYILAKLSTPQAFIHAREKMMNVPDACTLWWDQMMGGVGQLAKCLGGSVRE